MRVVLFKRAWEPYSPGDIAAFGPEAADLLISGGYAVSWPPKDESTEKPKKKKKKKGTKLPQKYGRRRRKAEVTKDG